jgi:lipopolysaccharide export system protein LptA
VKALLALALCAWTPTVADKGAPPRAGADKYLTRGAPVRITSEKLTVFNKENRAVFSGSVVARQGDLTVRCQELVAHYRPGGGLASLVATKKVRMRKGDRRAAGERLDYDHERRTMVLTGAPRLWEKESWLEGERVVFHLDDDRVEVERAKGRLKMEERR